MRKLTKPAFGKKITRKLGKKSTYWFFFEVLLLFPKTDPKDFSILGPGFTEWGPKQSPLLVWQAVP